MNPAKLASLQAMSANVRVGGKGTARRKKKIVHKASNTDDKKLQSQLKKLSINPIPGIEEVNMFKDDGSVIHFTSPKVQASPQANTFAISGQAETKQVSEMLPSIVNQLGPEGFASLRKLAMERCQLPRMMMFQNWKVILRKHQNKKRNNQKLLPSKKL